MNLIYMQMPGEQSLTGFNYIGCGSSCYNR